MKITIENTDRIIDVNGVPGRIWQGTTDSGQRVYCCITRIAAHADEDQSTFERDLQITRPPTAAAVEAFPARMVL